MQHLSQQGNNPTSDSKSEYSFIGPWFQFSIKNTHNYKPLTCTIAFALTLSFGIPSAVFPVLPKSISCNSVQNSHKQEGVTEKKMSLTKVKMSEEVWLTCVTHAFSTETEEIMGLLLGDIHVLFLSLILISRLTSLLISFCFFIF